MRSTFYLLKIFSVSTLSMLSFFVPTLKAENEIQKAIIEEKLSAFEGLKRVYKKNAPAVVKVFASKRGDDGKQFLLVGSGFFIDKQGHVLTNATIVANAENLWIDSKGAPSKATLVGLDPLTNVSVLKAETNDLVYEAVDTECSSLLPEIAEALLMISCELGQDVSPNMGFVTGHNIRFGEKVLPTVYLRTSIPIYGGSVGAPLFSLTGEFKGMAVAALPELDSSFVLPARAVNRIKNDILLAQKVVYGWFGLVSREIADNVNGIRVIVDMIMPNSPAESAGFKVGDVILSINGKKVATDRDLRWETFFVRAGEIASFKINRQGQEMDIDLQVARMKKDFAFIQRSILEITTSSVLKKTKVKSD